MKKVLIFLGIFGAFVAYLRQVQIDETVEKITVAPEVTKTGNVLENGCLVTNGFARKNIRTFDSSQISLLNKLFRFKQWDYFHLTTNELYIAVAFVDLAYVTSLQFTFYSLRENKFIHKDKVVYPFQTKQFTLEDNPNLTGNITRKFESDQINVQYKGWLQNGIEMRTLQITFEDFKAEFTMEAHSKDDMYLLKPFTEKGDRFFYSRKAYGWHSYGQIQHGKDIYNFAKANGGMDYGRGIFNYATFWLWMSAQGFSGNHRIGLNLGAAGNNIKGKETLDEAIFIDQEMHVIPGLTYDFDLNNLEKVITVKGENFYLEFLPKTTHLFTEDLLVVDVKFRQLIGTFKGKYKDIEFDEIVGLVELNRAKW